MNHAQTQPQGTEYTIYTFERPLKKQKGDIVWKKHGTSGDVQYALSEAQSLFESRKFHKIEVKKKFFDPRQNRSVEHTHRVFGKRSKSYWRLLLETILR